MRIRWRRLVTKSWLASRSHYQRHGLVLHGRPSDVVWYFAYGSNMHEGTFVELRCIKPLDSRVGRIVGYRLRFNLDGRPSGKSAPANICPDDHHEVWWRPIQDHAPGPASSGFHRRSAGWRLSTSVAECGGRGRQSDDSRRLRRKGKETDGNPSLRYISLTREGARANRLPEEWIRFLDSVNHAE